MDKFEMEQFTQIRDVVADLQLCFVDGDAFSRVPSAQEWRQATRLAHRLTLLCFELHGYATATRQYNVVSIRERLHFVPPQQTTTPDVGTPGEEESGFVEFTQKEIQQMPQRLRGIIKAGRDYARWRKRKRGSKGGGSYEIRFRKRGYNITASGPTLEIARANFLYKLKYSEPTESAAESFTIPTTFHSFATYYFENVRKRKVTAETFENDLKRYEKHIEPHFKEKPLKKITLTDCQALIDKLTAEKKFKTANEIFSLLNGIFGYAVDNHIIDRKPCDAVILENYESESGVALTMEEEVLLFERTKEPVFAVALALALYCGLRPNELSTATVEGPFIKAINSKRKGKAVEYKKIPICDRLKPYLKNGIPLLPSPQLLRRRVKAALPNHHLYDLRTTFYTRCKELNVAEAARHEFVGHSLGPLGNAYTDLSDRYLLQEGKKLNLWGCSPDCPQK